MFFNFVSTLMKDSRKEVETGRPRQVWYRGPTVVTPTPLAAYSVVQEGPSAVLGALQVLEHRKRSSTAAAVQFDPSVATPTPNPGAPLACVPRTTLS